MAKTQEQNIWVQTTSPGHCDAAFTTGDTWEKVTQLARIWSTHVLPPLVQNKRRCPGAWDSLPIRLSPRYGQGAAVKVRAGAGTGARCPQCVHTRSEVGQEGKGKTTLPEPLRPAQNSKKPGVLNVNLTPPPHRVIRRVCLSRSMTE